MKELVFTVDVEPDLRTGEYTGVFWGLLELEKLLDKYNIKPTLFVTCDCIEKYPTLFQRLNNKGWVIGLHGYKHVRFDTLTRTEKEDNIKKSIKCFKDYLGIRPEIFRGPQHAIDKESMEVLEEFGFKYDSSINPWNLYHILFFWKIKIKFSHHFKPLKPHYLYGFKEIPISSFILPFSSITLRILPKWMLKIFLYFIKKRDYPIFFMHSWDLIEIPDSKLYKLCPKNKFMDKLEVMVK